MAKRRFYDEGVVLLLFFFFFFKWRGASLAVLAVLPAVRVGKQTAPEAFITLSHARQVLEMYDITSLQLTITDRLKCKEEERKKTKHKFKGLKVGPMPEKNSFSIVTYRTIT